MSFLTAAVAAFMLMSPGAEADEAAIKRAALDYIESQHTPNPDQMARALHDELKKRTYWRDKDGQPFVMETSKETMLRVAETYNADGKGFPAQPKKIIEILDVDQNVASVKLTADDWIDYMHLMKVDGEWKIINVLWQMHDTKKQQSK